MDGTRLRCQWIIKQNQRKEVLKSAIASRGRMEMRVAWELLNVTWSMYGPGGGFEVASSPSISRVTQDTGQTRSLFSSKNPDSSFVCLWDRTWYSFSSHPGVLTLHSYPLLSTCMSPLFSSKGVLGNSPRMNLGERGLYLVYLKQSQSLFQETIECNSRLT